MFSQQNQDDENFALTGQIPSAPQMPAMPPPPAPAFNPQAGLPPAAPLPAAAMPPLPAARMPQDDLADFQAKQRAGIAKYGPEQQMAVEEAIMKGRRSPGAIAGNAMTGLADSLMQGVARAGPSNFQSNLQNRQDKTDEGYRAAMGKAQEGKMAQMKQEMEQAQMDPTSAISRSIQKAYGSTLQKMPGGQELTAAQIALIPASSISDILSKKVDLAKALAEVENTQAYRDATLEMQRKAQAETAQHARTEEGLAKSGRQLGAAKGLSDRPWYQKGIEMFPYMKSDATKAMQAQLKGEESPGPEAHPDYQKAEDWANAHPGDPMAIQIKKMHGTN